MSISNEVIFKGYTITAHVRRYTHNYWAASFVVQRDGAVFRRSELVTCRSSKVHAEAGALLMGIQYVDLYLTPAEEIETLHTKVLRRRA